MIQLTHPEIMALLRVFPPFVEAMRGQGRQVSEAMASINDKLLAYDRAQREAGAMVRASKIRERPA